MTPLPRRCAERPASQASNNPGGNPKGSPDTPGTPGTPSVPPGGGETKPPPRIADAPRRLHAHRSGGRDVHRGGDVRDRLPRAQPGDDRTRHAGHGAGSGHRNPARHARGGAGLRAARRARGARHTGQRRSAGGGQRHRRHRQHADHVHAHRLEQSGRHSAPGRTTRALPLRRRLAGARTLAVGRPGAQQRTAAARGADAS